MEELIKIKEDEIAKLAKMKDALRGQVLKQKKELTALQVELDELKNASVSSDQTGKMEANTTIDILTSQNIEKDQKIEEMSQKIITLQKELEISQQNASNLQESSKGYATDIEGMKLTLAEEKQKNSDLQKQLNGLIEKEKVAPLSPEKLMGQLKNGMFSLGKQNHSIETKIDQIIEQLSSSQSSSMQTLPDKDTRSSTSTTKSSYISPGLAQSQERISSRQSPPKDVVSRKPSDILKSRSDTEEKPVSTSDSKPENSKSPKSTISSSQAPTHGIQTIEYPSDGAIKCPKCDKQEFAEQENKKKVIAYFPVKKYAKKYYCKACRTEWDYSV
ncbi:hypothetical protein [Candidatus Lokiarchaeum ossiferum]|uniref:hypothetical protein n=1 Tax=Candidatus Lokiarchaeum ossiferum TaxID=2951803 RepID=UPI00352D796E